MRSCYQNENNFRKGFIMRIPTTDLSNDFELANATCNYSSNPLGVIKGAVGIVQLELRVRMVQFLGILLV